MYLLWLGATTLTDRRVGERERERGSDLASWAGRHLLAADCSFASEHRCIIADWQQVAASVSVVSAGGNVITTIIIIMKVSIVLAGAHPCASSAFT